MHAMHRLTAFLSLAFIAVCATSTAFSGLQISSAGARTAVATLRTDPGHDGPWRRRRLALEKCWESMVTQILVRCTQALRLDQAAAWQRWHTWECRCTHDDWTRLSATERCMCPLLKEDYLSPHKTT